MDEIYCEKADWNRASSEPRDSEQMENAPTVTVRGRHKRRLVNNATQTYEDPSKWCRHVYRITVTQLEI